MQLMDYHSSHFHSIKSAVFNLWLYENTLVIVCPFFPSLNMCLKQKSLIIFVVSMSCLLGVTYCSFRWLRVFFQELHLAHGPLFASHW